MATPAAHVNRAAPPDLADAYRECAAQVRRSAGNFYYAFRLLPLEKRRGLHALYRFCRGADDVADGDGTPEQRLAALEGYRLALRRTLEGDPPDRGWMLLQDTATRFSLGGEHLNEVIDGCERDCFPLHIETEEDLRRYCYGVAGVVGLLSAGIFRYQDPEVEPLAVRLGQAMQRTNILRDLAEDLAADRCYLPAQEIAGHGLEVEDLVLGNHGPRAAAYRDLMAHQVSLAREDFAAGLKLVPLVERDARGCPAALAALYQRLLEMIEQRRYDVQSERISLSASRKIRLALAAWASATLRP